MGDFPRELGSRSLESQNSAIVNYPSFVNYLRETVTTLLPEEDVEPALNSALEDEDNKKCVLDFLSNPHVWTLFVQRNLMSEEDDERENVGESETPLYCISNDIEMGNPHTASLVLTKVIDAAVNPNRSIHSQLTVRLVTDDDGPPYETLHAISKIMAPSLRSYVQGTGPADRNGDKMATSVQEEEAKLEMGLINLQNIDIPEISLAIHPLVSLIIKQCVMEGRKPKVDDFREKVEDSTFLNQLQNGVNRWIKEIQKVTKLYRDPESGTALQEIMFWLNLERALHRIQEKRESIEISLTLDILKHGKRFHATVSFDTDTGLKQALATVNDYNPLMKDFPINDLLSATELERIKVAVQQIFMHLRKIRSTKYPIQRVLRLVEAISRDLGQQLLKVLGTRRLMHIPFDEFEKVMGQCFEVFTTWDDEYDKLIGLLRDIVKKKREEHFKMVWRVSPAHKKLQTRMEHMRRFRRQHEQLRTVIIRVLKPTIRQSNTNASIENADNTDVQVKFALDAAGTSIIRDVNLAYQKVMDVDCLQNITKEGLEFWDAAIDSYESEIESVDAQMAALIRDQLGRTKNANEMFRIFSRINALLYRPHISRGIREYQTQLIQHVRKDIEALHEKFKIGNSQSKYFQMIAVRDLPPVAGLIIWVKQIDSRLSIYLKRLESVLGKGWENHIEGHKLKADGDSFRKKLSTQDIFDDWAREAQQRNIGVTERIFTIDSVRSRSGRGNVLKLKANFLPEIITLAKEVRNLENLGFRMPFAIFKKARQVDQIYPSAISLIESTRIYERTLEKIKDKDSIIPLVARMRKDVLSLISEGIALDWQSYKLDPYIQRLSEVVVSFQEKVEDLLVVEEQLDVDVRSIETCPYSANTFADILSKIQKSVDELSLKHYSNLHIWFARLDEEVEKNLAARLEAGIKAWTDTLMRQKNRFDLSINTDTPVQPTHKPGGDPKIQNQIHKVRITNETIHLYPSIEYARFQIMQQLVAWQAIVTSQMRLHSSTYQISLNKPEPAGTYKNLLTKLPGGEKPLEAAYEAIEAKMKDIVNYVDQWLGYQSLWDLQPDCFYGKLGDSINLWTKCLNDIKKTRAVLDALDTRRDFGSVIIDFTEAKSVIIMKHDSWYNEILGKLRSILGEEISTTDAQILQSTHDSEQQSVEIASDKAAVGFVTYVQSHSRNVRVWEKQFYVYKEGQRILERQRIQLPSTRTRVNHIEGEWRAVNDIFKHGDNDNDN